MRVIARLERRRLRDEERGAVLMIVAICLVVLLGMLVLVFDLGRGVAIRRSMVSASVSAALAAAQHSAKDNGTSAASAAAAELVASNKTGASVSSFSAPECDAPLSVGPKFVTVQSTVTVDYYFAQIFGFESGPVNTGRSLSTARSCRCQPGPDPDHGRWRPDAAHHGRRHGCFLGPDNSTTETEANSQWGS
jgi:Flp pilus assembly protein TadG